MAVTAYAPSGDARRGDGPSGDPARRRVSRLHGRTGRAHGADRAKIDDRVRDRERSRRAIAGAGDGQYGGVEGPHLLPPWDVWIARGSGGAGGVWQGRWAAGGHGGPPGP